MNRLRSWSVRGAFLIWFALCGGCIAVPLTVVTYNIHHGRGTDGKIDLPRIAAVLRDSGAQVIALQEVDVGVARSGLQDQPAQLAKLLGMQAIFFENLPYQGGSYGNALLTSLPVRASGNHHFTMLREGEQRGALHATLLHDGQEIGVVVTHLDYRPDDRERLAHAVELATLIREFGDRPVVLLGDLNERPEGRLLPRLAHVLSDAWRAVGTGQGFTFPSERPDRRIDYVLQAGMTARSAWVLGVHDAAVASDHRALAVRLVLGGDSD